MRGLRFATLIAVLTTVSFSADAAVSYDLATDFSIANGNPNGVWSYGHYNNGVDAASFAAFSNPVTGDGIYTGLVAWNPGAGDPNVIKNISGSNVTPGSGTGNITFRSGKVTFGPYLGPAVARFTAPGAGSWRVVATFATVQWANSAPAAWVFDGTNSVQVAATVPDLLNAQNPASYDQILDLAEGQYVDFVVWGNNTNNKTTEVSATIIKQAVNVGIDIKPSSEPNSINLCSSGVVPVAILGSNTFDVRDVDTTTLRFADASVKVVGKKDKQLCSYEDTNSDYYDDLVCHFVTMDISAINGTDISATVAGTLFDGTEIEGADSVNIVKDTCD